MTVLEYYCPDCAAALGKDDDQGTRVGPHECLNCGWKGYCFALRKVDVGTAAGKPVVVHEWLELRPLVKWEDSSMAKTKCETATEVVSNFEHGWAERRDFHPADQRLRLNGFRVHARPKLGKPVWSRAGKTYSEEEALKLCP